MDSRYKLAYANITQVFVDVAFLFITYFIAYLISAQLTAMRPIMDYMWIIIVFVPIWISIMGYRGMYNKTTFYYLDRIFRSVFFATFFSGLLLAAHFFFVKETSTSRIFIALFLILCLFVCFLERYAATLIYRHVNKYNDLTRIILVCSRETYDLFKKYVRKTHLRYKIIGVINIEASRIVWEDTNLGILDPATFKEILMRNMAEQVIFILPRNYTEDIDKYITICLRMGLTVQHILDYNLSLARVHSSMLGPMPVLTYHTVALNPLPIVVKRIMDIAGAIVGLTLTLIAAVVIVPMIKLDSPGPVIFKQKRVGRYGRIFECYKFRTMCLGAEAKKKELAKLNQYKNGALFKVKDDPRITRIGAFLRKTSLDELPQFFNVLKGDMSLVGTRPPTLDEVAHYDIEHWRRISIKPGITGNWQVSGRSSITDFAEVVALDTQYIDTWSIWLDIEILFKTVLYVFSRKQQAF